MVNLRRDVAVVTQELSKLEAVNSESDGLTLCYARLTFMRYSLIPQYGMLQVIPA